MYDRILLALDNSGHARRATAVAIELARAFSSRVVGVHVTNPGLHGYAFRQMEEGLPEEYQDAEVLRRQREIHNTIIERGLGAISDSYLEIFREAAARTEVNAQTKILKGRHYEALAGEINAGDYDLALFGAHGQGKCSRSLIGSVVERVTRRIQTDALIVRNGGELRGGRVVVGVDGSEHSGRALRKASVLARTLRMSLEAVHVFNPQFHHAIFAEMAGVLTNEAREVFNLERQKALHERIIDRGLGEVGKKHLQAAVEMAGGAGVDIETRLLSGKDFAAILDHVERTEPALLVVGRFGRHRTRCSDIGSTAENLVRLAPCHVLVVGTDVPEALRPAMAGDEAAIPSLPWTEEAEAMLARAPEFVRKMARASIQEWARRHREPVVNRDIVVRAMQDLLPETMWRGMLRPPEASGGSHQA